MLFWILMALGVYLVNVYLSVVMHLPQLGLQNSLAGRDSQPERAKLSARAERALVNFKENLPIFMALGLLSFVVPEVDQAGAVTGAMVFVLARIAYIPVYIAGVPLLRTLVYGVGMLGLLLMLLALL